MIFYALWSLVKPFIDPVTRTKVVFIEEKEATALFPKYFDPKVGLGSTYLDPKPPALSLIM